MSVATDGSIELAPSAEIRIKNSESTEGMTLELVHNGSPVAEIMYHFSEKQSVQIVESILADVAHNSPIMETAGYQVKNFNDKILKNSATGIILTKSLVNDLYDDVKVGPSNVTDIGTLKENSGVGWMDNNRMLLSFAAGDTVGDSTKWFQTYMMINMGDPVAQVDINNPSVQIDGLDRSVGTQIADSRKSQIQNFFERDMNNDQYKDILVQYADGYLELFMNMHDKFRSLGNIAYLPKIKNSLVQIGDFV